jgi:hypothetical protein
MEQDRIPLKEVESYIKEKVSFNTALSKML